MIPRIFRVGRASMFRDLLLRDSVLSVVSWPKSAGLPDFFVMAG
jgi:hypothetical protein